MRVQTGAQRVRNESSKHRLNNGRQRRNSDITTTLAGDELAERPLACKPQRYSALDATIPRQPPCTTHVPTINATLLLYASLTQSKYP